MANLNINKVVIGGKLTADPELKTTSSGVLVTSFSVAVNRRYKRGEEQETDFFKITAWKETADFICKYFRKGSSICIFGQLRNRNWTDQNGVKHYVTEIVADEASFVDAKSESPAAVREASNQPYIPESYNSPAYATTADQASAPKFEEISDDEDLPF